MKIKKLELDNFMIFNHLDVEFSPDINIISGENSTGKTALIKILYSCMKGYSNACWSKNDVTKDRIEDMLVNKIQGVFRLDKDAIGRLVNRKQGSNRADIENREVTELILRLILMMIRSCMWDLEIVRKNILTF